MNERELTEAVGRLSPRQKECLRLVFRRQISKEIAAQLGLSPGTVHTYCAEAVATLGARNRRHAAEILHFAEHGAVEDTPREVQLDPAGVTSEGPGLPTGSHGSNGADWRRWLPFRPTGAAQNDLPIFARLVWIPGLALVLAIGFGMLAVGMQVLSALYARAHG